MGRGPSQRQRPPPAAGRRGEGSIEGFGGCPSVPTGAYTAGKYAGNRKTRGAVTVKKVTNDCVFVLLTIHNRIFRSIIE